MDFTQITGFFVFQGCWVIKVCPSTLTTLLIARCLSGIAAGGAFNIVPLYVKEISQDDLRGTLGILMISSQNIGVLIIYSIGGFLDYHTVIWIVIGVPALAALLMFKAPESPAYLVKVGKLDVSTFFVSRNSQSVSSKSVLFFVTMSSR